MEKQGPYRDAKNKGHDLLSKFSVKNKIKSGGPFIGLRGNPG